MFFHGSPPRGYDSNIFHMGYPASPCARPPATFEGNREMVAILMKAMLLEGKEDVCNKQPVQLV